MSNKEVEVHFRGMLHAPLNIQGVRTITSAIKQAFKPHFEERVIFLELEGATKEDAKYRQEVAQKSGILYAYMLPIVSYEYRYLYPYGTSSEKNIVALRIDQILNTNMDKQEDLNQGLYLNGDVFSFLLHHHLELIQSKFPFTLEFESSSPQLIKINKLLEEKLYGIYATVNKLWDSQQFEEAVETVFTYNKIIDCHSAGRDKENSQLLKSIVNQALNNQQKTIIEILFGDMHHYLLDTITKDYEGEPVVFIKDQSNYLDKLPQYLVTQAIRKGESPSSDVLAQSLLEFVINYKLDHFLPSLKGPKKLQWAINYQDYIAIIFDRIRKLDATEIREICQKRVELNSIFESL